MAVRPCTQTLPARHWVYREYKLMVLVVGIRQFLSHTRVSAVLAESSVCHPEHHTSHVFGGEETIIYIKTRIALWFFWTLINVESNNWDGLAGSCSACSELHGGWCLPSCLSSLFSLILLLSSVSVSVGSLFFLFHLLILHTHSMFSIDVLWRFCLFIPVGCLIFLQCFFFFFG